MFYWFKIKDLKVVYSTYKNIHWAGDIHKMAADITLIEISQSNPAPLGLMAW